MPDIRDNRGKNLDWHFIIFGVIIAIISGYSTQSDIQRYIENHERFLKDITNKPDGKFASRAHLPRLLNILDLDKINEISRKYEQYISPEHENKWINEDKIYLKLTEARRIAIDGKNLRGSNKGEYKMGASVVRGIGQITQEVYGQEFYYGEKASEIDAARELIKN